jgi:hypothetical protein
MSGASWTPGKYGSALDFNGTSARVDLPALGSLFYDHGYTLEAWVRRDSSRSTRASSAAGTRRRAAAR